MGLDDEEDGQRYGCADDTGGDEIGDRGPRGVDDGRSE
jgi:hypothetical protein